MAHYLPNVHAFLVNSAFKIFITYVFIKMALYSAAVCSFKNMLIFEWVAFTILVSNELHCFGQPVCIILVELKMEATVTTLNQWNFNSGYQHALGYKQFLRGACKFSKSHFLKVCLDAKNMGKPILSQHPGLLAILLVKQTAADSFLDTISESKFYRSVLYIKHGSIFTYSKTEKYLF